MVHHQVPVLDPDQRLEPRPGVVRHLDARQDEVTPLDVDQGLAHRPLAS